MAEARQRPDVELLNAVALIEQHVRLTLERVLPDGLTAAQFAVLAQLNRSAVAQTPGSLAAAAGVTRGAMTSTLQKLEARGLAAIVKDELDDRRKRVSLSEEGLAAHHACLSAARLPREALRREFAATEFEQALPFLRRLQAFLGRADYLNGPRPARWKDAPGPAAESLGGRAWD